CLFFYIISTYHIYTLSLHDALPISLLFGLAERIGPGTVAEKRRGVQRAGRSQQLKLFPSHVEVPDDDPQVARVLVNRVRLERTRDRKSTRLNSSHVSISYAVFCLKK